MISNHQEVEEEIVTMELLKTNLLLPIRITDKKLTNDTVYLLFRLIRRDFVSQLRFYLLNLTYSVMLFKILNEHI